LQANRKIVGEMARRPPETDAVWATAPSKKNSEIAGVRADIKAGTRRCSRFVGKKRSGLRCGD